MQVIAHVPLMASASLVGLRNRLLYVAEQLGLTPLEAARLAVAICELARGMLRRGLQGDIEIGAKASKLCVRLQPWDDDWRLPSFLAALPYRCEHTAKGLVVFANLAGRPVDARRCQEIASLLPLHVVPSRAELEMQAMRDALTGLYNRHAMHERLAAEIARARRYRLPLSLLMLDIDHFKRINDGFGHPAGDACLRDVAALIRSSCRAQDLAARFGGEEFVVVLPHTDGQGARELAERLRRRVEGAEILHGKQRLKCTISIGMAVLEDAHAGPEDLIEAADRALYAAKQGGRNRVCCAT